MSSETRSSPVKEARTALGLRLKDVADQTGMSMSLISMIEHGYIPQEPRRKQLAGVLGKTPETLWPET